MKTLVKLGATFRRPTIKNFAWLITGIFFARSVNSSRVALELGWDIKLTSITRRLSRLLANKSIRVREFYNPIVQNIIQSVANTLGQIRLIVDGSKVSNGHQLLMIALAYRKRAIPIVWTWVPHQKGHSSARVQMALLSYARQLIPSSIDVLIVGDAEFGSVPVMKLVDGWKWSYVFRQQSSRKIKTDNTETWQPIGDWVTRMGQKLWLGAVLLTQTHAFSTNLYIEWRKGEKDPWLLATNLKTAPETRQAYKRRMWIEEMFGDFKSNGFDLERSKLRHFQRLSRLTLAVVLLYIWLLDVGSRTIKNGKRSQVDRNERRDYSIFRIGYNFVKQMIGLGVMPSIRFKPYLN